MGDRDLVKPLLESRGKIFFGRVLMKPGKPLTFAVVPKAEGKGNLLVFGLPGNPVSSVATWLLVVVPVLRKLSGMREPALRRVHVRTVRCCGHSGCTDTGGGYACLHTMRSPRFRQPSLRQKPA